MVLATPGVTFLVATGENGSDLDVVIREPASRPGLVGYVYNESHYGYLKYGSLIHQPRRPVIALGSSRVLGIRAQMFDVPFFNAGYTIESIGDFRQFLHVLPPEKRPETVLMALDQWMFNPLWNEQTPVANSQEWTANHSGDIVRAVPLVHKVYRDFLRGRLSIGVATGDSRLIGLNARCNGR
ncbi:MAG: hypothetical protein KDA96_16360, partial [Planctomycetaceae bacterium]|nr:hypothetical protein [Planctomycetaceae bacterium]